MEGESSLKPLEPLADRGPRAGSPREVVVATGCARTIRKRLLSEDDGMEIVPVELSFWPVATALGSDTIAS